MWINNRKLANNKKNFLSRFNPFRIQVLVHILRSNNFFSSVHFFFLYYILVVCSIQTILYSLWVFAYDKTCIWASNYRTSIFCFSMMGRREYLKNFQSDVMFKQNQIEWTKKTWFKYRFRLGFWRSCYRILSVIKC